VVDRSEAPAALPALGADERRRLARQRLVGRLLSPLWVPLAGLALSIVLDWRIENARETRAEYRRLRAGSRAPLLVCANHLTMVDSLVVAWALGSPLFFLRRYASLPWNLPEERNFAATWWSRVLIYVMKCLPIRREADRKEAARVLSRVAWLLSRGDVALIFPEGGRSRSGRVEADAAAYGVGRLVRAVPDCRVLCVYVRGRHQTTWSDAPVRGERFRAAVSLLEPKSDGSGLRASLEISRQIVGRLMEMEQRFHAG
jgi:1-acyl-sn-glycerol-3-phosphate acyltransferase